jgi:hypothetical protein
MPTEAVIKIATKLAETGRHDEAFELVAADGSLFIKFLQFLDTLHIEVKNERQMMKLVKAFAIMQGLAPVAAVSVALISTLTAIGWLYYQLFKRRKAIWKKFKQLLKAISKLDWELITRILAVLGKEILLPWIKEQIKNGNLDPKKIKKFLLGEEKKPSKKPQIEEPPEEKKRKKPEGFTNYPTHKIPPEFFSGQAEAQADLVEFLLKEGHSSEVKELLGFWGASITIDGDETYFYRSLNDRLTEVPVQRLHLRSAKKLLPLLDIVYPHIKGMSKKKRLPLFFGDLRALTSALQKSPRWQSRFMKKIWTTTKQVSDGPSGRKDLVIALVILPKGVQIFLAHAESMKLLERAALDGKKLIPVLKPDFDYFLNADKNMVYPAGSELPWSIWLEQKVEEDGFAEVFVNLKLLAPWDMGAEAGSPSFEFLTVDQVVPSALNVARTEAKTIWKGLRDVVDYDFEEYLEEMVGLSLWIQKESAPMLDRRDYQKLVRAAEKSDFQRLNFGTWPDQADPSPG